MHLEEPFFWFYNHGFLHNFPNQKKKTPCIDHLNCPRSFSRFQSVSKVYTSIHDDVHHVSPFVELQKHGSRSQIMAPAAAKHNLSLVPLASPTSGAERIKQASRSRSRGDGASRARAVPEPCPRKWPDFSDQNQGLGTRNSGGSGRSGSLGKFGKHGRSHFDHGIKPRMNC